jgi:hypothetical protein
MRNTFYTLQTDIHVLLHIGSKILGCGVVHRGFLAGYWGALRATLVIGPSIL